MRLLAALAATLLFGALTMQPAFAATRAGGPTPGTQSQLSTLQQQLQQQLTTLNTLTNQEDSEKASVSALTAKVSADQLREQKLGQQLNRVARIEYERPALTLVTVMDARNLGQLMSGMAQARVISQQQQQLLNTATALKASDQQDQAAAQAQLNKISQQQARASAIASSTRSEIATLQQQLAAQQSAAQPQASTPAASTSSSAAPVPSSGSVQSIIKAAFASLGANAQQWGLCIAYHESGDNPNAVQPGAGGAEGLFQFEYGTWLTTPEGAAGDSIFSAAASSAAAAWEYGRGNYNAWTTNAIYCSQYD